MVFLSFLCDEVSWKHTGVVLKKLLQMDTLFPLLASFAEAIISLPITNAQSHRGACLSNEMLESLLHISVSGPEVCTEECDPLLNFLIRNIVQIFPKQNNPDNLINSVGFRAIINLVTSAILNFEPECVKNLSFGAKRFAEVNSLEVELRELQAPIFHLKFSMEASSDNSSLFNAPCCSSTSLSLSSYSCSSIEDT